MIRTVLYSNPEEKNIDFENIDYRKLKALGFSESVAVVYEKDKFCEEDVIKDNKKICESAKSELVVIYKEEYADKIITCNFNRK